ncbi:MAG TPA: SPFH domain-containing protein [Afifellaceae bacterium]|nr:SPFH domain-containing protein [Afifellaceae bacterium]
MIGVILGIVALAVGVLLLARPHLLRLPRLGTVGGYLAGVFGVLVGLALLAGSSFVVVNANSVGHLNRIYAFEDMEAGQIIAMDGQKGPQARILGPGFHLIPLVRVLYDFEDFPVVSVPEGYYGQMTTLDGARMPDGMFIAPSIPDTQVADMLKAEIFLSEGGIKGPQETVLKPGNYRINRYLFNVNISQDTKATLVPAGHVGVVKSNVRRPDAQCVEEEVATTDAVAGALSVPLVPEGCVGIWKTPLFPGAYYLNRTAFEVTLVDTRVKTWEYKGGFTKRIIDLSVDQEGNIRQNERTEPQPVPSEAADQAVFVKVEGWDIPQELRVLVQVSPENAPIVVGAVGGLEEIENRILTPAIRSIVRNVAGSEITLPDPDNPGGTISRSTRVLDLIESRDALEQNIEALVKREGRKAGVDIREIRLGEPSIPPELLVSRLRQQLADQLSKAYERETAAQGQRIETEQARSTANEQPRLVAAQIAVQVARQREEERAALGRAERQYLEELARGQRAQADVLGQDRVALLQALEKLLVSLERKPELVALVGKLVPNTVVGDGSGLAGAAAIFGQNFGEQGRAPAPQ